MSLWQWGLDLITLTQNESCGYEETGHIHLSDTHNGMSTFALRKFYLLCSKLILITYLLS